MAEIGHCKHGEFNLLDGCEKCIAEREVADLARKVKEKLANPSIVKVKYYSDTTGELSAREYTYYSADPLKVGDIVIVPVRDTTGKAKVSAIDVPKAEIVAFEDKLKIIPAGSVIIDKPHTTEELSRVEIEAIAKDIEERRAYAESNDNAPYLPDPDEDKSVTTYTVAVRVKPETDEQVQSWYNEALGLQKYAEARVIKTVEDLKPANDDLVTIRRLKKLLEEKRKEYVKPLQDHVKSINDSFKTFMEPIEVADKVTSQKILAFTAEQGRIRKEQEEINQLRIEAAQKDAALHNGEISEPVNLVEVIPEVPTTIKTEVGSTGQRDNWKWEVQDINLVPREYLMINVGMLTPVVKASKGKIVIPGIKIYNEPILATR